MSTDNTPIDWSAWSRDAVASMTAKNDEWTERYGLTSQHYQWDLETTEIAFTQGDKEIVATIQFVGSSSNGRFLWGWANKEIPPRATKRLQQVHQFGQDNDLPMLVEPELPGGRAEGMEIMCIAGRIMDAAGIFIDETPDEIVFLTLHDFGTKSSAC